MTPEDFDFDHDPDYYSRKAIKQEIIGRLIVIAWIFAVGVAVGAIGTRILT